MSKVKKTVVQIAKQIAKNQGVGIVQAIEEMEDTLKTEGLHFNRVLIVDTDDGSYELQEMNLIETIRDCAQKDDLDEALLPVMISLGFVDGGTTEFFVMEHIKDGNPLLDISRKNYSRIWENYTVKQRATILCKFVATFVETAIED